MFPCYIFQEIALEPQIALPMRKFTFDSILLLGNHANLYSADIIRFSKLPVQSLTFKKKNPFLENEPHQLLLNGVYIDYNGNYSLNELSFALSVVVNHNKKLKNTIVVGDPSELLYQAYVFAQTNQNPNFIREQTGAFLHRFQWLSDNLIGELPLEWNWLEGEYEKPDEIPAVIHYTNGGAWFNECQDVDYAQEWLDALQEASECELA